MTIPYSTLPSQFPFQICQKTPVTVFLCVPDQYRRKKEEISNKKTCSSS